MELHNIKFFVLMLITILIINVQSADSVDVTFRYNISGQTGISVPGEFNGWNNTAWPMSYQGGDLWTRTARLAIGGNPNPPPEGVPGAWQYKFYYNGASPWPNDPLNHHINQQDNDNSYLFVKDLTIYHLLPNQRQGIIDINTPTISAFVYPKVGTTVDTSNIILKINNTSYSNLGSHYDFNTKQLSFTRSEPLSDGTYTVILDVGTNADTVNFVIQTGNSPVKPLPAYANHGVTLPSSSSNDSTTFRLRVGGTNSVLLRVAPAGQPVTSAPAILMRRDISSDNWWINLDLVPGTYEYLYQTDSGSYFYDPWGKWNGEEGSRFTIGPAGLTADNYEWRSNDFVRPPLNQLIIYELHIGEFAGGYYGLPAGEAGFVELASLISYFDTLGVNAIELMPINDYGTVGASGHSWGYDLNTYFALEPDYGTPHEFKVLVDSAHARGIAVIVDVVFNHQNDTGPLWQMQSDLLSSPYFKEYTDLRFNEDALFFFRDMDHWTPETQEIVYESLKMWIDEYRVDGFRYDFTQGCGWNVNEPDVGILGWADRIDQDYNGQIYQIAEHLPESPALIFYSGLTGGWHDSYHDEIFDEARFRNTSLTSFENLVLDLSAYPGNDTPSTPLVYANSTEPVNANVNHDEQSLIYEMTTFQGVPLNEAIQRDKLYAVFMFTSLGIPMLWQGIEFSAPSGWMNDNEKLSYRPLEWALLSTQRGQEHYDYFRSLIFQRKNNPALYDGTLHKLFKYNTQKVLVWGFDHPTLINKVMAIANLSDQDRTVLNIPWLDTGDWYDIFDQSVFTVSSTPISNLTIPAYTVLVYTNKPDSSILAIEQVNSDIPKSFSLSQNYPNPFNPETTIKFQIPKQQHVTLQIFDILGRKIKTLTDHQYIPGVYELVWNGQNERGEEVGSGIYILQMQTENFIKNRQMILVK
jgi:1,4-alpha-glucan branching enzyme